MLKPIRFYFRLILAFISKFKLILLFAILAGMVFFISLTIILPKTQITKQKIGVIGEYNTNNLPESISDLISMGLTKIDKSGKPIEGIASSWEVKDNGKIWIFHLNKDIKWQDGSNVTANDINYNFSDATVSKPDKYTIEYKLKTPLSNFPVALSKPAFKQGLLGVGEWKVQGLTLAGTYVETLTIKKGDNEKLFKFYPTEERAKLAYELGEINSLNNLMSPDPFNTWGLATVAKMINKNQYVAVFFNTSDNLLADKEVRQALSYAIDKSQYEDIRALGPISPDSWAYNPTVKPYDWDSEHAKELIDNAKIDPNDKKNMKIRLNTVPDLLPVAEKISENWKEVGVTTTLQVTSFVPDDYQAFVAIYDIPTDPDQYSIWHSTQMAGNITRYKNTRIDKLLEDGRLETNETKRKAIYFDFQKYLLEDAPAAFLFHPAYYSVTRK